jgi:hypothetical protein
MFNRCSTGAIVLFAALTTASVTALAFDEAKYPDLKGQWDRVGAPRFDPSDRSYSRAPLTPEARAVFDQNLKDQAAGGQGTDPTYTCVSPGMPRSMNVYEPMEIVVTPNTTYILIDHIHDSRRIFTDGRPWPKDDVEPTFQGYSIGTWIDTDGDGRFDLLEVETRNFKGPRAYDASGLLLHSDNQSVIKERIYVDKTDKNTLINEITVTDNALTRPWSATKKYKRVDTAQPTWREVICAENNNHVEIAGENYFLSADGFLMPARKDQPAPDLKYFKPAQR